MLNDTFSVISKHRGLKNFEKLENDCKLEGVLSKWQKIHSL